MEQLTEEQKDKIAKFYMTNYSLDDLKRDFTEIDSYTAWIEVKKILEKKRKVSFDYIKEKLDATETELKELWNLDLKKTALTQQQVLDNNASNIVLMSKFTPVPYARKLMEQTTFILDKYNRFWRYDINNGIYKEDACEFINFRLREGLLGDEQQKNNYVNEVIGYIKGKCYEPEFEGKLSENIIPFKNCLYDLNTGEFIQFSPKHFVTNKIPVEIDSQYTECPIIDGFFTDIVTTEMKETLYELMAYCMYRGYPYQKLFFLFGAGKNGKTTYLELLREFLGIDNVASVSPHEICSPNKPFAMGLMWNKYANISSDISYEVLKQVNKIKEVTGGDTVTVERKYKEGFPTKIYAKQIYSTNQIPMILDKTDAWYRRIYLIEFPNRIMNPDREILKKMLNHKEMSGLAWACVKKLKAMRDRGFVFRYDIDEQKIAQMYEDLSNPLSKFVRENCVDDTKGYIFKYEFKERFEQWCKDNKLRVWNETEIGIEMKKNYDDGKKTVPLHADKRYWAWEGIKWESNLSRVSRLSKGKQTLSIYIDIFSIPPITIDTMDSNNNNIKKEEFV